ncbi:MmcQ/YjbR family DNA-binding protein [Gallaecimonas sp. GXIMD4217]|uniref:MmcQ/YjbR family DNA-binding protein n=1 Tax=Gallaecimonas sp. GXIMD4217 TaxID=3131927 RepID=UPI00311AC86D
MDRDAARAHLLGLPEAVEDHPFGPDVAVFKVGGKMFATLALGKGNEKGTDGKMAGHWCMNLKCEPNQADMLRSHFPAIIPGYHMSKSHWNTVILDGSIPEGEVRRLMEQSYDLIVASLRKAERERLARHRR